MITVSDLHKSHVLGDTEVHALRGISLGVKKAEFVAVVGPSGSGKSTLLHCLAGLDRPSKGSIQVAGVDLTSLDEEELARFRRQQVGVIFQFFNLLPDLTVLDNVSIPLMLDGVTAGDAAKQSRDALDTVGLADRLNHRPAELSGGEMQRCAIARALAIRPAVILADEPTGNLDSDNGRRVLEQLRTACDSYEQTIVIVTHDEAAAGIADRIITLRDGLIENGAG